MLVKTAVIEHPSESVVGHADITGPITIVFDPKPHRYTVELPDGRRHVVPSVTQVLEGIGKIDTRWYPKDAAARGSLIHTVTAWLDRGTINLSFTKGDEFFGWYEAWEQFKLVHKFRPMSIERIVVGCAGKWPDPMLWAGTIDRDGVFGCELTRERYGLADDDIILIDLKSGAYEPWHKLQLEGYRDSYPSQWRPRVQKFGVYLKKTGLFEVRHYTEDLSEEWFDCLAKYYRHVSNVNICLN